jgi:hypothetical protein
MAALAITSSRDRTPSGACIVRSRADVVEESRPDGNRGFDAGHIPLIPNGFTTCSSKNDLLNRVVSRRAVSDARLGVRAEHVSLHLERAVLLPLEHDKVFAGPRSGAS